MHFMVLTGRTSEQMLGFVAELLVTEMVDILIWRNRAVGLSVGVSMDQPRFTFNTQVTVPVNGAPCPDFTGLCAFGFTPVGQGLAPSTQPSESLVRYDPRMFFLLCAF
jgi:hypothetical protein